MFLTAIRLLARPLALLPLLLSVGPVALAQQAPAHIGKTVVVEAPQDAWQKRRQQTLDWIRDYQNDKLGKAQREAAYRQIDQVLTAFDKNPFGITPMEAMDLLQLYYIPSEDNVLEDQLLMVSTIATLGWYDALRFADESGRAEIVNNEQFFKRAIFQRKDEFIRLLTEQPDKAAAAVGKGIATARAIVRSKAITYDTQWPTSYGLLRMQCGLQGTKTCASPRAKPETDWPAAWDEAAARVTRYYRLNKD